MKESLYETLFGTQVSSKGSHFRHSQSGVSIQVTWHEWTNQRLSWKWWQFDSQLSDAFWDMWYKNVTSSSSNRALTGPFVSRDLYIRSWLATGGNDAVNYSGWGSGLADNNGWDYGIEFVEKDGKRQERLNSQSRWETLITPANFAQEERTEKVYREASSHPSLFHESFGLCFCSSSRDEPRFSLPFQILQLLMDIDSLLLKWRCKFFINKCN